MNIAIFTNNYLPNPYGVTGSIESFRTALTKEGHTVFVFAPMWKGYVDHNPHVYRYPAIETSFKFRFPIGIPFSVQTSEVLKHLDIDIVHAQHPNLLGLAASHWAHKKKIPLIFTWHTLYNHYIHFVPFVPKKIALMYVLKNAVRYANNADYVIVPTPSILPIITKWGVTNPAISAVATGVDPEQFKDTDGEYVRKKYHIKHDQKIVLTNARLSEEKNMPLLFDIMCDMLKKNMNVVYIIISGGDLLERFRERACGMGLASRIIFTGEVQRDQTSQYYSAADLFVYASRSETQGMVVSEAMYSGVPVVAFDGPGVCDLVEDGVTGFVVSDRKLFGARVQDLLDHSDKRKEFGVHAKKTARQKYVSAVCADRLVDVYKEAIAKK